MRPPLLLLALLGPLPTTAFYPTKFRANLSMIPGISHEQMTEEVLASAATSLFPPVVESLNGTLGAPLSRAMLEARTEIVRSNVWVDWGYPMPEWHFDSDSVEESAQLLEAAKAAVVKHLMDGDTRKARVNLGHALHLVQDYFAHSAAKDGGELERMWRRDLLAQSAQTSGNSRGHSRLGESRYDMLTGRSGAGSHGAARVDTHLQKQGAEEARQIVVARHDDLDSSDFDRHLRAVELAKEFSVALINDVAEYLTDRQLQHLFGISLDSAILVDPTAFASPDWDKAQGKISALFDAMHEIETNLYRAVRYSAISLLSQSPQNTYDDWSPLTSTNASRSLRTLRDTVAGYGIGCHGISLERVLSALQQFKSGGELILVVGQDFLEDGEVESQIVDFIANNPVAVTIMRLDTECPKNEELTLSQSVAELSGGTYITALDTRETLAFPGDGTLEAQAGLSVIQINSHFNATSQKNIRFPVDGAMDRLLITADWADTAKSPVKVLFSDPENKSMEPVASNSKGEGHGAIWKIDSPKPGMWGFSFGEGPTPSYNITVKGRSSIQLVDASFVENGGIPGHEGYFAILKDVLPAKTLIGVVGEIYGLASADISSVEWFIVGATTGKETKIPMTHGLDPAKRPGYADQNTFFGNTTLPEGDFYVVVRGVDAQGYEFQRSVPSRLSAKYYPDETFDIGDVGSVLNFPKSSEDEGHEAEAWKQIFARQIVTGTGGATGTGVTSPGATPLTPTGPFFPNTTSFPGTGATTLGTNATATPLPTGATSAIPSIPATSGFNTSVPSVTIPVPGATNTTGPGTATETAGATILPPAPVPTGSGLPSGTESLTTVATVLPPGANATSGIPFTSSVGANATATSVTAKEETEGASTATVTITAPCYGPQPPGQTIASESAISQPGTSSSAPQGCKACGAPAPEGPVPSPKETSTEAQKPVPYSQPEKPQETEVIPHTAPAETTVETTKTRSRTSVIPAKTPGCAACAPDSYGSNSAPPEAPKAPVPSSSPVYGPGPFTAPEAPASSSILVYGPGSDSFTAPSNGTHTGKGHAGHTTSSGAPEGTSGSEETADESAAGETASGEGVKGVRAGVVAVVVVAVGGVVFLIL